MKVLIINASPRKGASDTMKVTRSFLSGMREELEGRGERLESELIHLDDCRIIPCRGCLSCWGRTEGQCVITSDDVEMIKAKVLAAEVVVLSFPLFFFGMPGTLKVMTDRLLCMLKTYRGQEPIPGTSFHGIRYGAGEKRLVLISTCGYGQTDLIYDSLLAQYDCIAGAGNYDALLCPQGEALRAPGLERRIAAHLAKFGEAGRELVREGRVSRETQLALRKPMLPKNTFRILLNRYWDGTKEGAPEGGDGDV